MRDQVSLQAIDQMHLILTRPRTDSAKLARRLTAMSHSVLIEPMLTIYPCPDVKLKLDQVAAIFLSSANGARALADRTSERELPVFCVGDATADAAKICGFKHIFSANGDVTDLSDLAKRQLNPRDGVLLHVAGNIVAGNLTEDLTIHGYKMRRANLYRAEVTEQFSDACLCLLRKGNVDGVLFFSPRSAATFVKLLQQNDLVELCRNIKLFGLSRAVAEATAGVQWNSQNIAALPRQDELLALLKVGKD